MVNNGDGYLSCISNTYYSWVVGLAGSVNDIWKSITDRNKISASHEKKVLVLRTCNADMSSFGGFVWPIEGPVECDDFIASEECGNGLHGFLRGQGNGLLSSWSADAKWLVVEVLASDVIELEGKVKFQRGNVLYAGDRITATDMLKEAHPDAAVIGSVVVVGGTGTAIAGDKGKATAGSDGTATAGCRGKATAGDSGTATAGALGEATAGNGGTISITYYDNTNKKRIKTGYIGENGLLPNTAYKIVSGEFVVA